MILLTTNRFNVPICYRQAVFEDRSRFGDSVTGWGNGNGGVEDMSKAAGLTPNHVKMCLSQMYLLAQVLGDDP